MFEDLLKSISGDGVGPVCVCVTEAGPWLPHTQWGAVRSGGFRRRWELVLAVSQCQK